MSYIYKILLDVIGIFKPKIRKLTHLARMYSMSNRSICRLIWRNYALYR